MDRQKTPTPFQKLSKRESQIALMLIEHQNVKQIAQQLALSPKTIQTYRRRVFNKLGITDNTQLILLAQHYAVHNENGILRQKADDTASSSVWHTVAHSFKKNLTQIITFSLSCTVVLYGCFSSEQSLDVLFHQVQWVAHSSGSFIFLLSSIFLLICLAIIFSPIGNIRLGRQNHRPEFSTVSWIAMMTAAGFGSGLLLHSIQDPIVNAQSMHWISERLPAPARHAMFMTMLHRGIHSWAIYGICALIMALPACYFRSSILSSEPIRLGFKITKRITQHKYLLSSINMIAAFAIFSVALLDH